MDPGEIIGAIIVALVAGLLGALITAARIGGKVDRLAQTVENLLKQLENLDSEFSGFAPIGGGLAQLSQQVAAIGANADEHRKADGHTHSIIRLTRIEDRLDRIESDVQRLFEKWRNDAR